MKAYSGTPTLESPAGQNGIIIYEKAYITLIGITAINRGTGIGVKHYSHHIVIENCTVINKEKKGYGIDFGNVHHCEARNCTTESCYKGIRVSGGHDNIIADCFSHSHYCYSAENTEYLTVTCCRGGNGVICGHGITFSVGGGGPESPGCSNCVVTDSEMYNCWDNFGVRHKGHHITFVNCYAEAPTPADPYWYNHGFYFRTGAHDILTRNCRVKVLYTD